MGWWDWLHEQTSIGQGQHWLEDQGVMSTDASGALGQAVGAVAAAYLGGQALGALGSGSAPAGMAGAGIESAGAGWGAGAGTAGAATVAGGATGMGEILASSVPPAGLSPLTAGTAGTATAAANPGFWGTASNALGNIGTWYGGLSPTTKYLGGLAIGSGLDYLTKSSQISNEQEAMRGAQTDYLNAFEKATTWSPEDRSGMMNALYGIYSNQADAAKRRAAEGAASRGTGGGGYGQEVEKIDRAKLEAASQALSGTYGPSGQAPAASAFFGPAASEARSPGTETMQDVLGLAGNAASNYFLWNLMKG